MPSTISAALRQVKAASDAAGATVMGPALRDRIRERIVEEAASDDLWDKIQNAESAEALTELVMKNLIEPVEADITKEHRDNQQSVKRAADVAQQLIVNKTAGDTVRVSTTAEEAQQRFETAIEYIATRKQRIRDNREAIATLEKALDNITKHIPDMIKDEDNIKVTKEQRNKNEIYKTLSARKKELLAVLGLMLAARLFSSLGELMVELLYQLIHKDPAPQNSPQTQHANPKASATAAGQFYYNKPEATEQHSFYRIQQIYY